MLEMQFSTRSQPIGSKLEISMCREIEETVHAELNQENNEKTHA